TAGQPGQAAQQSNQMRDVAREMQGAAGDMRRQDSGQARARGGHALEKLRDLERQLGSGRQGAPAPPGADERRRALGDLELETRQLADAQRQVASELAKSGQQGDGSKDTMRRLAGEEDRLAERTRRLQDGLKQAAAGDAARELTEQRLADRMQKSADDLRAAAQQNAGGERVRADAQQQMASTLDKVADKLQSSTGSNGQATKLSDQLARAQALHDRVNAVSRELERLGQQKTPGAEQGGARTAPGDTGRSGRGQSGGGSPGGPDLAQLREEYSRQLKETADLIDRLRRDDPSF